jgi:hypothetical protein
MIQIPTENWFKFPNHIADNLQDYDPYELKILVFMLRRTVGMLGLTANPDQRFSLSFLAKNTGLSKSQIIRAKKSLIAKGAILEEGEGEDGSHLLSVSWSVQQEPGSSQQTQGVFPNGNQQAVSNGTTDKDSSLKKEKENTLDASASSAAPEKEGIEKIMENSLSGIVEHDLKEIYGNKKEDKIPYKEIQKLFLDRHREFRKVRAEIFMPSWNAKEQKAIKRLYEGIKNQNENGPKYIELDTHNILLLFGNMIKAFTEYLKNGRSNTYTETTPILPSQLTDKVLNRLIPYLQKEASRPKLEIKKYEQTGIHIGPMPEGW